MDYANDRIRFDTKAFDFASLVREAINGSLEQSDEPCLSDLGSMHAISGIEGRLETYRQLLFSQFRTAEFQRVYRAFGAMLIDDHFTPEAIIQKTPTVRIHLDGGKSVSFHSDAWYGHGTKVCSFWLPLTPVSDSNSLYMARSLDESREFLGGIAAAQLDLDEINELATALCDPVTADFGDLIVFNADMVHGTVKNSTGRTRVSFDFRIAESVEHIGTKPANNFFTREELDQPIESESSPSSAEPKERRSAYMYSGICRGVSAKSQLVFLNEYARIQGIDIIGSESEIVTFDYCPVLQKYTRTPPEAMTALLLFSVDLLPSDAAIRKRLYQNAIANGIDLIFCAEDFAIVDESTIEQAERLLSANTAPSRTDRLSQVA